MGHREAERTMNNRKGQGIRLAFFFLQGKIK